MTESWKSSSVSESVLKSIVLCVQLCMPTNRIMLFLSQRLCVNECRYLSCLTGSRSVFVIALKCLCDPDTLCPYSSPICTGAEMSDGPGHWFHLSSVATKLQANQLHVPLSMSKTFCFVATLHHLSYELSPNMTGCINTVSALTGLMYHPLHPSTSTGFAGQFSK